MTSLSLSLVPKAGSWGERAAILLRIAALVMIVSSLLVLIGLLVGHTMDEAVQTGNLEANDQNFTLYVEDTALRLRVDLTRTCCVEHVPDWLYPDSESFPIHEPPYSVVFRERTTIVGVLNRCR